MGSEHYADKMREKDMPIAKLAAALAGIEFETISGMAGIVSNSTAMTAIAASGTAMTAIAASGTAMTAIAASQTALSALNTSPLLKKYNPTSGNAWTNATINGKGIFVKVISYQAKNNKITIDNGTAEDIENQKLYAKAYKNKLLVYYVPYSVSGFGVYYIPC